MTNSIALMALVMFIYTITAISLFREGHLGMAICFVGYVIGNLGMIIANIA